MRGFLDSCRPVFETIFQFKYIVETVLIFIACAVLVLTGYLYMQDNLTRTPPTPMVAAPTPVNTVSKSDSSLFVDISGAVRNPRVYRVPGGSRVYEVIAKANGFTDDADTEFIGRNINQSRIVSDQEKIYIPSRSDIMNGYVAERPLMVEDPFIPQTQNTTHQENPTININTAVEDELDQLPGIGVTLAGRIIENRPYQNLTELVSKGVLKQSAYDKIKDLISVE